jgi:hypothetical protein
MWVYNAKRSFIEKGVENVILNVISNVIENVKNRRVINVIKNGTFFIKIEYVGELHGPKTRKGENRFSSLKTSS